MQNLLEELRILLAHHQQFAMNGNLLKNKIVESALKLDADLIKLLLQNDTIQKHFFTQAGEVLVFDKVKFQKFVSNKQFLPDSYTAFKNKIGLTSGDEYIADNKDVVLAWAYKDCVLEGGQTKEDQKRNEIFWNETLAPDEIDRLLSPKVFTNFKRYSKNGEKNATEIFKDDNLMIEGNNLLVLSSLVDVYGGKIKMIYIDPPYNTGNDGFKYNDSFNHSTWLTFMKNRLSIARQLLSQDGIIFISCDDREFAYLKVLTDEIFGRDNYITSLIWRKKAGGGNDSTDIAVEHEYILTYRKKMNGIYKIPLNKEALKNYKYSDSKEATHGKYSLKDLNDPSLSDSPGLHFDIECPDGSILKGTDHQWKCNQATFLERLNDDRIVFKQANGKYKVYYKIYLNEEKGKLRYDSQGKVIQKGRNLSSILYDVALNKEGTQNLKEMFDNEYPFEYPKPVNLIKTLIRVATQDNDFVLDFFAGSGTTAQAVLEVNKEDETNRKFILVEQMNYAKSVTAKRIENYLVKKDDDSSFVFFGIKEKAEQLIPRIHRADETQMDGLVNEITKLNFCKFNVDVSESAFSDFYSLDLSDKKKILIDLIDKNQYYVALSEIDDADNQVADLDKKINARFYSQKFEISS